MSNKKKNEVALSSNTLSVPAVLERLNAEVAKLKHISDSVYKTSGTLTGFGDLKNETKIENLVRAFSMVRGKENAYNDAAKELELKQYPQFTVDGGTAADWKQDILLRINILEHKDKLDKLNAYKEKMSQFLSAEDQKAIVLKEMAELFS